MYARSGWNGALQFSVILELLVASFARPGAPEKASVLRSRLKKKRNDSIDPIEALSRFRKTRPPHLSPSLFSLLSLRLPYYYRRPGPQPRGLPGDGRRPLLRQGPQTGPLARALESPARFPSFFFSAGAAFGRRCARLRPPRRRLPALGGAAAGGARFFATSATAAARGQVRPRAPSSSSSAPNDSGNDDDDNKSQTFDLNCLLLLLLLRRRPPRPRPSPGPRPRRQVGPVPRRESLRGVEGVSGQAEKP